MATTSAVGLRKIHELWVHKRIWVFEDWYVITHIPTSFSIYIERMHPRIDDKKPNQLLITVKMLRKRIEQCKSTRPARCICKNPLYHDRDYRNHYDRICAYRKKWDAENRDKTRSYFKKYYLANREKVKARVRERYYLLKERRKNHGNAIDSVRHAPGVVDIQKGE